MSGGSHEYICFKIEECLGGQMHDLEMNELVIDLAKVAHDLEWWDSSDISEKTYRDSVKAFKAKWFGSRDERLVGYINESCDKLKAELTEMIIG